MPQYPLVPRAGGSNNTLDITAATVIKATPGTVFTVSVLVAGSTAGAVYDAIATTGNTVADQIAAIPDTVSVVNLNSFPCLNGIVVAPGTGQTLAVAWS